MSTKLFNFEGNYKAVMEEYVSKLEGSAQWDSRAFRMYIAEKMTDAYVEQTGRRPDGTFLERLANVILHEELTDRHPDKMTREEYPILSERQYDLRSKGKRRERRKDGTVLTEVPLEHGVNVATDGENYSPNTRSFHNKW